MALDKRRDSDAFSVGSVSSQTSELTTASLSKDPVYRLLKALAKKQDLGEFKEKLREFSGFEEKPTESKAIVKILNTAIKDRNAAVIDAIIESVSQGEMPSLLAVGCKGLGVNPIFTAISYDSKEVAIKLLPFSREIIDVTGKVRAGVLSCLHLAVVKNDPELVGDLINAGADIELEIAGLRPLHMGVIRKSSKETISSLVRAKACIDAQDDEGNTPLHIAAQFKNDDIISFLLENGANRNVENNDGKKPSVMADEHIQSGQKLKRLLQTPQKPKAPLGTVSEGDAETPATDSGVGDNFDRELFSLSKPDSEEHGGAKPTTPPANPLSNSLAGRVSPGGPLEESPSNVSSKLRGSGSAKDSAEPPVQIDFNPGSHVGEMRADPSVFAELKPQDGGGEGVLILPAQKRQPQDAPLQPAVSGTPGVESVVKKDPPKYTVPSRLARGASKAVTEVYSGQDGQGSVSGPHAQPVQPKASEESVATTQPASDPKAQPLLRGAQQYTPLHNVVASEKIQQDFPVPPMWWQNARDVKPLLSGGCCAPKATEERASLVMQAMSGAERAWQNLPPLGEGGSFDQTPVVKAFLNRFALAVAMISLKVPRAHDNPRQDQRSGFMQSWLSFQSGGLKKLAGLFREREAQTTVGRALGAIVSAIHTDLRSLLGSINQRREFWSGVYGAMDQNDTTTLNVLWSNDQRPAENAIAGALKGWSWLRLSMTVGNVGWTRGNAPSLSSTFNGDEVCDEGGQVQPNQAPVFGNIESLLSLGRP